MNIYMEETSEICQKIRESLLAFEREFSTNVLFSGLTGSPTRTYPTLTHFSMKEQMTDEKLNKSIFTKW